MICGECIYFLAGAGCRKRALSLVHYDTLVANVCPYFVDVDTVME